MKTLEERIEALEKQLGVETREWVELPEPIDRNPYPASGTAFRIGCEKEHPKLEWKSRPHSWEPVSLRCMDLEQWAAVCQRAYYKGLEVARQQTQGLLGALEVMVAREEGLAVRVIADSEWQQVKDAFKKVRP